MTAQEPKPTKRQVEVRDKLPEELRPIFDELVFDYQFHASTIVGWQVVNYLILAELVKAGWRPPERRE